MSHKSTHALLDVWGLMRLRKSTLQSLTNLIKASVNDTDGHVYLAHPDPRGTSFYSITSEKSATYETVKFSDMNKNKRSDIVTARMVGGAGELMWLAQPNGKKDGWTPKVVHQAGFKLFCLS